MVTVIFEDVDGTRRSAEAQPGISVMQAAIAGGIPGIEAACGGSLVCGTCHAYVPPPWFDKLSPPSDAEKEMLEYGIEVTAHSRMMCQVILTLEMEGLVIYTPASQR